MTDQDRRLFAFSLLLGLVLLAFLAWALLAVLGVLPAAPWSPLGEYRDNTSPSPVPEPGVRSA